MTTAKINPEDLTQLFDLELTTDDFTLELYLIWAKTVTENMREYQQVIANSAVSKWFVTQIAKHKDEYELLIQNYTTASITDRTELYLKCVYPVFSHFPLALLKEAKKRTEKPRMNKAAGINIEFNIVNLN